MQMSRDEFTDTDGVFFLLRERERGTDLPGHAFVRTCLCRCRLEAHNNAHVETKVPYERPGGEANPGRSTFERLAKDEQ